MKSLIRAGILIGVTALIVPAGWAADTQASVATTDVKQMLAAIGHPDYNRFVAPTTSQFKASVDAVKFAGQAKTIDSKIPLAQPYTVKFVTTQKVGGFKNYIFEITLHTGDQVLASVTLQRGKVAGFHLL